MVSTTSVVCSECHRTSVGDLEDSYFDLNLTGHPDSICKVLAGTVEVLKEDSAYACSTYNRRTLAVLTREVIFFSEVVLVHVTRMNSSLEKDRQRINVPKDFFRDGRIHCLVSAVIHHGNNLNNVHYTTLANLYESWFYCDDSKDPLTATPWGKEFTDMIATDGYRLLYSCVSDESLSKRADTLQQRKIHDNAQLVD